MIARYIGPVWLFVIDQSWMIDINVVYANKDESVSSEPYRVACVIALMVEFFDE